MYENSQKNLFKPISTCIFRKNHFFSLPLILPEASPPLLTLFLSYSLSPPPNGMVVKSRTGNLGLVA